MNTNQFTTHNLQDIVHLFFTLECRINLQPCTGLCKTQPANNFAIDDALARNLMQSSDRRGIQLNGLEKFCSSDQKASWQDKI
jgi:hypothetical protein